MADKKIENIEEIIEQLNNEGYEVSGDLKKIVIPEGTTEILDYDFYDIPYLEEIELPKSLRSIGDWAFMECTNLKRVSIPYDSELSWIGQSAFEGCESLEDFTFPDNLLRIQDKAFYNCKSLDSITLPASLADIGRQAFEGCDNLSDVEFSGDLDLGRSLDLYGTGLEKFLANKVDDDYDDYNEDHELDTDDENSAYYTGSYYNDYDYGDYFESKKKLFNSIYKRFN